MSRVRRVVRNDLLVLSFLAIIVGIAVGWAIVGFREGILLVQLAFYGTGEERLSLHTVGIPWWHILLAPALGGLVVGPLVYFFLPGRRPHGVADVIEANALAGARLPPNSGFGAALVSMLSIGAGASVGREGPAVHFGATIGSWMAGRLGLTRNQSRTLLGCGAAAAVAASFNAPIAGALFANEVIIGHYALSAFAPVVVASVAGTLVTRAYFGSFPAFILPDYPDVSFWEFPAVIGLGIVAGVAAAVLVEAIRLATAASNSVPGPQWLRPAAGGLMVGLIAIPMPEVLGVGYGETEGALANTLPLQALITICLAKIVATSISLGFGFGGGVFSPALVIGATLGGAYGVVATWIFPELSSGAGAYAVMGMGAVAASVLGAPISTTLIVFEMTADYSLTMAAMLSAVVSAAVYRPLSGQSFFGRQLHDRGLDLHEGFETTLLRGIRVGSVLSTECDVVSPGTMLNELRKHLQYSATGQLFVVENDSQKLIGSLTLSDLSEAAYDSSLDHLINAADAAKSNTPTLEVDDTLENALKILRSSDESQVAVVESYETGRFLGCLNERDAMNAYTRAILESRRAERE